MTQPKWIPLKGEWSLARKELLDFAQEQGLLTRETPGLFQRDTTENLWQHLPQTEQWLADRGWRALELYWILLKKNNPIHIDSRRLGARINFPVWNCEGSRTTFHSWGKMQDVVTQNQQLSYEILAEETDVIDSLELTQPTVLDVSWPHRVEVPKGIERRISASILVSPDAYWLLRGANPGRSI